MPFFTKLILIGGIFIASSCQTNILQPEAGLPSALKDVPATRLNYRYEPDVPGPADDKNMAADTEKNGAV